MQDQDIFSELKSRLMTHGFDHGERLRAEVLRSDFGCAASTIREILFRLTALGLVEFREQRGFRVPQKSRKTLNELAHLRVLLEQEGTVQSIRNGGVSWEAKLTAAHHQLSHIETRVSAADDPGPLVHLWFAAERGFHQMLISACDSEVLKETHERIYCRFRQQLMEEDAKFDYIAKNIEHHQQILHAALAGDEDLTRRRIAEHLDRHAQPHPLVDAGMSSVM